MTAVLLAGGESRRMLCDKRTLIWRGRPLWQWQMEKLRQLHPAKILLSARRDVGWRPLDVDFVPDVAPFRGPLSGISAALAYCETEHLLVLAVDMPFISALELGRLWQRAGGGTGVVPVIGDRAQPVAAIYPRIGRAEFTAALRGTDFSLHTVVEKLSCQGVLKLVQIPAQDSLFYRSLNEPRDLEL